MLTQHAHMQVVDLVGYFSVDLQTFREVYGNHQSLSPILLSYSNRMMSSYFFTTNNVCSFTQLFTIVILIVHCVIGLLKMYGANHVLY